MKKKESEAKAETKKTAKKAVSSKTATSAKTVTEIKQIAAKPEPKKITTKKEPKKLTTAKEPKRIANKEPKRLEQKKKTKKQLVEEKMAVYAAMTLEESMQVLSAHGFMHQYWDIVDLLMYEPDLDVIVKRLIETSKPELASTKYETDGCDVDLVESLVRFVKSTMEISASDFQELANEISASMQYEPGEAFALNSEEYLKEFKLMEKLLMIGQRYHLDAMEKVDALMKHPVSEFPSHFMKFAYQVLPEYQYKDVIFYENFMYEVLGQFADIFERLQLELQLDVADLYIKHGDHWHGDEDYRYLLRDNQIKDYIYYRYASVYLPNDPWKAKQIAESSFAYVDWRYHYYDSLVEIASMQL